MIRFSKLKSKWITALIIVLSLALIGMIVADSYFSISSDMNKMVSKAETLWNYGLTDKAIQQLNLYLKTKKSDLNGWTLLASYYHELSNFEKEDECYQQISINCSTAQAGDAEILLTAKNNITTCNLAVSDFTMTIEPENLKTENMVLTIIEDNLMPQQMDCGAVEEYSLELSNEDPQSMTTDWFPVSPDREYLTISGGFNTALWQFCDEDGDVIKTKEKAGNFNLLNSYFTGNKIYATVKYPSDACKARVTFWNGNTESAAIKGDPVYIVYGQYPENVNGEQYVLTLPDLALGEKLVYSSYNQSWVLYSGENQTEIDLKAGFSISKDTTLYASGIIIGNVRINYTEEVPDTEGEYGVRWEQDSLYPVCERVGDAQGLDFGYMRGNNWIGTAVENDFDNIYPWSDIRLCTIDSAGDISYAAGADALSLDGSDGDVMVEIPKFYSKREIIDGYEYIWISAAQKDGYTVDPAFVTQSGVVDTVYVGAYLAGGNGNSNIESAAGDHPYINLSLDEVNTMIADKGNQWESLDYVTLAMLQKLFLVETACRDSQALFLGQTNMNWASTYAASSSEEAVNTITIVQNSASNKYAVGDAVTIFDVSEGTNYYTTLCTYQNNDIWDRVIDRIEKTDDNMVIISFSGDPITITKDRTLIMHLPNLNGETNDMTYPTGEAVDSSDGNASFRYRYIENLWGAVCVMLDNITVTSNKITITYPNGVATQLSYDLVTQTGTTSQGVSPAVASIEKMGFDPVNPMIVLPTQVGNGASSITGYCDALFYIPSEMQYIMTYGLTWDLRQYAGLFAYRANFASNVKKVEAGSRLIFR